jgi:hypothetical protein
MSVKTRDFACAAVLLSTVYATAASAQSTSTPYGENWQVQVAPYLWGSAIDGQFGIANRTADVDASFGNILDHLHFAAMGRADARLGRLVALGDVLYVDVRGQRATPGPLFSSVNPQQKLFIGTPEAGYRLLEAQDTSLDVVGGLRLWHLNSEMEFRAGVLPAVDLDASRTWVDAIVGLRARKDLPHGWWASGYGDVGRGGSDLTYQIAGTAGVDLHKNYALLLGYRYLSVDYDTTQFRMDAAMRGPVFGLAFKF